MHISRPVSRLEVFWLKNWMLIGNYLANFAAFVLMEKLIFRGGPLRSAETRIQLYFLSAPDPHGSAIALQELRTTLLTNSLFFIVIGLTTTLFVHVNFNVPLREIIQALKDIRHHEIYGLQQPSL